MVNPVKCVSKINVYHLNSVTTIASQVTVSFSYRRLESHDL